MFALDSLTVPIVQAPLAGGASTPALAAAVCDAGALGFLAAGYKRAGAVAEEIGTMGERRFGVNLFAPPGPPADPDVVAAYAARLGNGVGEAWHDDDDFEAKLALLLERRPAVVSFTFGAPRDAIDALRERGVAVWVTVTTPEEAVAAGAVDALVVQGAEAGGHRASFDDGAPGEIGLLALLQLVRARVTVPLVATGGIATGAAVAAVLVAGAAAAQIGTAFMLAAEAGTAEVHRTALATSAPTALTRAFTGRSARGIVNAFMTEHSAAAPSAYPEIHHLTAPIRAGARASGDRDRLHLWAGQAHELAAAAPAAEIVTRLWADAQEKGRSPFFH